MSKDPTLKQIALNEEVFIHAVNVARSAAFRDLMLKRGIKAEEVDQVLQDLENYVTEFTLAVEEKLIEEHVGKK